MGAFALDAGHGHGDGSGGRGAGAGVVADGGHRLLLGEPGAGSEHLLEQVFVIGLVLIGVNI